MVNRPAKIGKYIGRDFSIKEFLKICHLTMVGRKKILTSRTSKYLLQHSEHDILRLKSTVELAHENVKENLKCLFTKIPFYFVLIFSSYLDA